MSDPITRVDPGRLISGSGTALQASVRDLPPPMLHRRIADELRRVGL